MLLLDLVSLLKKILLSSTGNRSCKPISFIGTGWFPKRFLPAERKKQGVLVLSRRVNFSSGEETGRPGPGGYLIPHHVIFQGWGEGSLLDQHGRVVSLLFQVNCSYLSLWSLCFVLPILLSSCRGGRRGEGEQANRKGLEDFQYLNSGVSVLNNDTVLGWDRYEKHFGFLRNTLCTVLDLMRLTALDTEVTVTEGFGTNFLFPGAQLVGLPEACQIPKCALCGH